MGRMSVTVAAALLLASCVTPSKTRPVGATDFGVFSINPQRVLLGPEAFPFCGGWVELRVQHQAGEEDRVFLKAAPPPGQSWKIWNAHVVVEDPARAGEPIRFTELEDLDTAGSKTNVVSWKLNARREDVRAGIRVALKPFEGCAPGQETRGVVLKPSPITLAID